jgi:hypothetical protein
MWAMRESWSWAVRHEHEEGARSRAAPELRGCTEQTGMHRLISGDGNARALGGEAAAAGGKRLSAKTPASYPISGSSGVDGGMGVEVGGGGPGEGLGRAWGGEEKGSGRGGEGQWDGSRRSAENPTWPVNGIPPRRKGNEARA